MQGKDSIYIGQCIYDLQYNVSNYKYINIFLFLNKINIDDSFIYF